MAERDESAARDALPAPPDPAAVNASWPAAAAPGSGPGGWLSRLLLRFLAPQLEAQRAFNADQVRLDNALLRHLDERLAATHRHYDRLLGEASQRLDEVDERHAQLSRELVAHVHDLARRIDLVLAEAERGRPALEHAVAELRARVARLEDALRPHAK
ncbi:MAG: hypothetical protein ACHP85_00275 [Burkholderiales bacterium]